MSSAAVAACDAAPVRARGMLASLRPLVSLLRPHRRLLAMAICSGALNQLLTIASAVLGAYLVGRAADGASASELREGFVVLVVLVIPRATLPWLESLVAHAMAFRTLVDIRARVHDAFERLAPGYLLEHRSGDLGSAVIGDVEQLELFFAHTLSPLVVALTVPIAAVATLALFHWALAVVLLPTLVVMATVPRWLERRAEIEGRAIRDQIGESHAEVVDSVQGLRELISFGCGSRQLERLTRAGRGLRRSQVANAKRSAIERSGVDALVTLGMLIVLVVAAALVVGGSMPVALFPPAVVLAAFSFAPMTTLFDVARDLNVVVAAANRLHEVLSAPAPVEDRVSEAPHGRIEAVIRFENVSFSYGPGLDDAIANASFEIGIGETVALVGHSGAGKSTIAHLLMRFWDVRGGRISVGGHDIRELPQHTLRELITFVPQDVYLFAVTLRENIRLAHPDATDAQVEAAARAALADEFITGLPDGYDSLVGERGTQLSGGQRQRIALARALLKDAPILVLDEAVSNLDVESEQELAVAMQRASEGRTTLVIAHRLSTIRRADRIVVLERGRVIEQGCHEELAARPAGTYAALIGSQAAEAGMLAQ